jgi:hypothetical protein
MYKFALQLYIFVGRTNMYLQTCGSFNSANHKDIGFANRKSTKCHICGRSANLKKHLSEQIADLRFAELICGPPTFGKYHYRFGLSFVKYSIFAGPVQCTPSHVLYEKYLHKTIIKICNEYKTKFSKL